MSCTSIQKLSETIKSEILTRFSDVETHELIAQATLLDPRVKTHGLSGKNADKAINDLRQMCAKIKLNSDQNDDNSNLDYEVSHDRNYQHEAEFLVWGKFDKKTKNLVALQNATASSIIEVDKYLNEILLDRK